MNSTTSQPIFYIDQTEIIGNNDVVLHEFVKKQVQIKYSKDITNNPVVVVGKSYRLVGEFYMTTLDKQIFRIEIRKHKSVWVMMAHKENNTYYLLKLIRQTVQKITHPCFLGKCTHDTVI
jgi:hypothetical protein